MLKKKKLNRVIAVILSIIFALSVFPTSESIAAESLFDYATETDADDIDKSDTDTMTDEKNTEAVVEAEASETVTEETTTEELTTEETVEEVAEEVQTEPIPTFNVTYEGVNISGKDFSSCELLIATEDPGIFTYDTEVVSEYNGIYLTRYPDESKTMNAYTYYYTKAPLVEVNTNNFKGADEEGNEQAEEEPSDDGNEPKPEEVIETSPEEVTEEVTEPSSVPTEEIPNDGHGEADLSNLNNGDDAFSNVNDLGTGGYSGYIALIDTGANGADASVSVIGSTSDDNGHGTKMAAKIREMNPNARILSIKALDSSNRGRVSDIYSAINYAIDSNVSIINLSLTSLNTADSELVVSAIQQAINRGIVVVGAAGNYGSDASYFVPGCVSNAIICTATDETGVRLGNANFGSNIDYYVIAGSTSEAAATVSGLISRDGLNFCSDLVRTEEGMFSTESDADVDEIDSDKKEPKFDNLGDNASDEAEELNSQAELNEYLSEHFKWLGGVFKGQAPSGYPDSFNADVWFNQTSDRANSDGVIGYLSNWNIRGGISTSGYDFVAGSQAVYCGCVARGVASVSHSYTNTTGGHTHYSGPNSGQEHLCITPGVQAGNWNNLQITNTTFAYVDQVTYNGQSYARYKTTDGVDQYLDTAGVQYVDIYVYVRKTSQPGFISLHKSGKKANGAVSNLSRDGIVYGLYDDEHLDSAGNNKIAEFTLGADGYPKSIQVTTARATAGVDGPITGDDGHLYLKWISEVTPQNWYFKEISSNNNYQLDPNKIPVS
ncbi:MAG: hypothetical protein J6I58_04895, partial [Eubacterium sp.]|nr:hypothetical protein [Eubacterium sp.]